MYNAEKAIPTANLIENGKIGPQGRPEFGPFTWPICSRASQNASSTCRPHPSPLNLSISSCFSLIFVHHLCKQIRFEVKQTLVRNKKVVLYCAEEYYTKHFAFSGKSHIYIRFLIRLMMMG